MNGEFKLLRHLDGRCAFARVAVSIVPSDDGRDYYVADAVETFPGWKQAARDSCTRCLELLATHAGAGANSRVIVTSLITTTVDTTVAAIEAASALAVANAFGLQEEFVLHYDKRWRVEWPSKQVRVV